MKAWARIGVLVAALALVPTFFFPLWHFAIWAPQYPEGLFMQVWTYKLSGDVQSINTLNHYIGMHAIDPESLKELTYFPYVIGAFCVLGLLVGALKLRRGAIAWSLALFAFCVLALWDFYSWEYKFGHDLSDDAPIKMEGMQYQPPLIGTKTLLTITAESWPSLGGYALTAALGLAVVSLIGMGRPKES